MDMETSAPQTAGEPLVELINVNLKSDRGGWVFRDLSLTLRPGQSAVIVGGSGSGKTMLVELLLGVRFADSGIVRVFGEDIKPRRKRLIRRIRQRIGGVGGIFGLIPKMTVAENLTLPLVLAAERRKTQRERTVRLLSEFSLLKLGDKYPDHLTRVESCLAQFARAAVANQPLMIIDEPSAGLDAQNLERIMDYLVQAAVSGRSMILLMSHEPTVRIPNSSTYRLAGGVLV
jgi:putative ABC transport system ATP-binding protein